ncbi:MAG: aminopeptidase [Deltaproteobacteria bacterium]|nr:aminopeptidase [Candidatus Zymogenaceae bacterium]
MTEKKKSDAAKKLEEKLLYRPKPVWDKINGDQRNELFSLADDYKAFLAAAKTERLAVRDIVTRAKERGFVDAATAEGKTAKKLFMTNRNKAAALAVIGTEKPANGLSLIVSHIDSPRLDLKQRPLYEDIELALMKTHYYGGIKKYNWVSRPLSLHGVVITADGKEVEISIGEDPDDPVFTVSDLLIHLAGKAQMEKKISEAVPAEKLNILCGSIPFTDAEVKERVKLAVMSLLNDTYGIVEEDLISAELEMTPAGPPRDVGFDRSMIGGYGQDDRISAFSSLRAALDAEHPARSFAVFFMDKEEIGSEGVTGARGRFIEEVMSELLDRTEKVRIPDDMIGAFSRSVCLSADVNGALDPDYQEVHEAKNAARLGYGVCVTKFTGSRGKSMASDASAELVGRVRKLFNENNVVWQHGELGKVDEGGGGTIAKDIAERGIDVIDCGPVLLDMHSPFEISSKADLYMAYRGFRVFLEKGI